MESQHKNPENFPEKSKIHKSEILIQKSSTLKSLCTNGFFLLVRYNKLGIVHCTYRRVIGYNFQIKLYFFH